MAKKSKYLDARWQQRRLEILSRDSFSCTQCPSKYNLHVHHLWYEALGEIWDSPDEALVTLCSDCHKHEHDFRRRREGELSQALRERQYTAKHLERMIQALKLNPLKHPLDDISLLMGLSPSFRWRIQLDGSLRIRDLPVAQKRRKIGEG